MDQKNEREHRLSIEAIIQNYEGKKSRVPKEYQCSDESFEKLSKVLKDSENAKDVRGSNTMLWVASTMFVKNSPNTLLAKLLGEYWAPQPNNNPNTPGGKFLKTASELKIRDEIWCFFSSKEQVDSPSESTAASYIPVLSPGPKEPSKEEQKNQLLQKQETEKQKLLQSHKDQSATLQEKKVECQKQLLASQEQATEPQKQLSTSQEQAAECRKQLAMLEEQVTNYQKQSLVFEEQIANYQKQSSTLEEQEKELSNNQKKEIEELEKKQQEELAPFSKSESTSEQQVPTLGQ